MGAILNTANPVYTAEDEAALGTGLVSCDDQLLIHQLCTMLPQ